MKKILTIILLLISLAGFGQNANYYVSQSDGDDSDSGLTPALAWKTINKLDATTFQADDSIFFNRGDTWKEQFAPLGDGTSGHNVVITAYGTGSKPLITARDTISGFSRDANWTNTSGSIWVMAAVRFGSLDHIRLFVDGTELNRAQTAAVNSTYRWFFDSPTANPADDRLYLYSATNPGSTYTNISTSFGRASCIILNTDNYFTISNLELQDGQSSIDITNCAGTVIDSCRVSGWYGIWISGGTGTWSDGGEIKNCIIDSENTSTGYTWNPTYTYDAIKINGNVKNWNIHDNYVKDYGHSSINLINTTAGRRIDTIKFYNNLCRSPNQDYGGRIEVDYLAGSGNEIYRNKIQNISISSQINGENLKFYYNIIDTVKASVYSSGNAIGIIISGYELTSTPHNMEFYNNVIANCADEGFYISHALGTRPAKYGIKFINNILYNNGGSILVFVDPVLPADSVRNNTFKNNIIYDNGSPTPITYRGTAMSATTFNTSDAEGDIIADNIGTAPIFITGTRQPNLTSPAINAGLDLQLTTDNVGNPLVGMPDIGSLEYQFPVLPSTGLGFQPKYFKENVKDTINIAKGLRIKGVPILATASELNQLNGFTGTTPQLNHVTNLFVAGDTTVTAIVSRIVFQASDSSLYVCRSTVAPKKWYKLHD